SATRRSPPRGLTFSTVMVSVASAAAKQAGANANATTQARKKRRTASSCRSGEPGIQLLAGIDQPLDRTGRLGELRLLGLRQLQFDDTLDSLFADHRGHADIEILDAVRTVDIGGAGQHALLVLQIALRHRDRRG